MNVTKTIAQEIAEKLLAEKFAEIGRAVEAIQVWTIDIIGQLIPKEIKAVWEKYPNWFNKGTYWYFDGPGINHQRVILNKGLPYGGSTTIQLHPLDAKEFIRLHDDEQRLRDEYATLNTAIVNSLVGLRTYKNVQAEFPEAYFLLPQDRKSTALVVNIKDLRCKLNTANCA